MCVRGLNSPAWTDCWTDGNISYAALADKSCAKEQKRCLNVDFCHIYLLHPFSFLVRVPLETLDCLVLLDLLVLALTCLPLLDWVRLRRVPTRSGTWGLTRPPETCVSTTLRSTPRSSRSTTRLKTSAALRDPRRILLAPAGTWSSATLTGRAVSDSNKNQRKWREKSQVWVLLSDFVFKKLFGKTYLLAR